MSDPISIPSVSVTYTYYMQLNGHQYLVTVHGPREVDRHIFPGTTLGNRPTEGHSSLEFAGKMSQSPARERLQYLKQLDIGYYFYAGSSTDEILKVLNPTKKTILHIPKDAIKAVIVVDIATSRIP